MHNQLRPGATEICAIRRVASAVRVLTLAADIERLHATTGCDAAGLPMVDGCGTPWDGPRDESYTIKDPMQQCRSMLWKGLWLLSRVHCALCLAASMTQNPAYMPAASGSTAVPCYQKFTPL